MANNLMQDSDMNIVNVDGLTGRVESVITKEQIDKIAADSGFDIEQEGAYEFVKNLLIEFDRQHYVVHNVS